MGLKKTMILTQNVTGLAQFFKSFTSFGKINKGGHFTRFNNGVVNFKLEQYRG